MSHQEAYRLPPAKFRIVIVEMAVIVVAAFLATHHLLDLSPSLQLGGGDLPLVTHNAGFAARIFQQSGAIPLWNPFIGNGEPMFESPQSFILNPLMSVPVLLLGSIVGTKVSILLHIAIIGLGGWMLARMLGLGWAGRLLLGVFLVGSGSMAAPMGRGLYQLTLSQAYIPWIFASLIGVLYFNRRWCVGMFAAATMLLVFAGTFWYVLPTAISCALLSAFAFVRKKHRLFEVYLNRYALRRLLIAALFVAGLCAIRLLPIDRSLLHHPSTSEPLQTDFLTKFSTYFSPITLVPDLSDAWMNFHYVLPSLFGVFIFMSLFILFASGYRRESLCPSLWRITIPGIVIIGLFTLWGQGETDFKNWLYTQIPFLLDWRNTGRIAAAASIWIVVLAAIGFDMTADYLIQAYHRGEMLFNGIEQPDKSRRFAVSSRPLIVVLVLGGGIAAADMLGNWQRFNRLIDVTQEGDFRGEEDGLVYLRSRFPGQMLLVQTQAWVTHFGFVNTLSRYVFGDADVFTNGLRSTLGGDVPVNWLGRFAVGSNPEFIEWARYVGYRRFDDAPRIDGMALAWYNPNIAPYAFWVPQERLANAGSPIVNADVKPVTYMHRIDNIDLIVSGYLTDAVLVVNETRYPGWTVTSNGQPSTVESIGGRLGVILPPERPGEPTYVTFSYQPRSLQIGAVILFATVIVFVGYVLRLDQRLRRFQTTTHKQKRTPSKPSHAYQVKELSSIKQPFFSPIYP